VIASACVYNNYLDREIDKKMARTKHRALAQGLISNQNALIYASCLGVLGLIILAIYTNILTVLVGIIGLIFYVIVYGIAKRRSVHGTLVGSISGALPPVAGYLAVSNHIDAAAISLFFILVFWQMPHFYAIAIYRLSDYRAAGLPVLPVKRGVSLTKRYILLYILVFGLAAISLSLFSNAGLLYFMVATVLTLLWFIAGLHGYISENDKQWARKMFGFSLIVMIVLCIGIGLSSFTAFRSFGGGGFWLGRGQNNNSSSTMSNATF
jgi:protoheme IX farnesyltransferase